MFRTWIERVNKDSDLAHGQGVIIAARWIMVLTGLLLTLWNPGDMEELRVSVALILALAVTNFFLHTQLAARRPNLAAVTYAASAADIAVISLVMAMGEGVSHAYVFYMPALLAISVAFPTPATAFYTGSAMAAYLGLSAPTAHGPDMLIHLLALAGTAICGNVYWRIEADRRKAGGNSRRPQAAGKVSNTEQTRTKALVS